MSSGIDIGGIASIAGSILGGPIGGLIGQLAGQVMGGLINQVIDQLPIGQGLKDLLQAGFQAGQGGASGADNPSELIECFCKEAGASDAEVGDMQRAADDFKSEMTDVLMKLVQTLIDSADDTEDGNAVAGTKGGDKATNGNGEGSEGASGSGGSSASEGSGNSTGAPGWLYAIAEVMGRKLDETAHKMADLAEKVDSEDPSTATDFQVASQQFSIIMNTTSTALKSIGEGMVAAARKQ